ncbi:hypothetical protein KI387_010085 [Taxus chinensis]|uniref:Uncharacterized protein n=1 Tax=Taxus chinensis TaxID=29808 RepID=A0AA38FKM1_TAXCH|nr:hypothetical protein KI387_010085 [Taxus chinensis]
MKHLSEEDGWELFSRGAGLVDAQMDGEIERFARGIAKDCKGHPLAIKTLARTMPAAAGERATRVGVRSEAAQGDRPAVLPHSRRASEGSVQAAEAELRCAGDRAAQDLFLVLGRLPRRPGNRCRRTDKFVSHSLREFPDSPNPQLTRISVMHNQIRSLPQNLECTMLLSLMVSCNRVASVPEGFLEKLCLLKVLDLSNTPIKLLPASIGQLKQLVYLQLSNTQIKVLPYQTFALSRPAVLGSFFLRSQEYSVRNKGSETPPMPEASLLLRFGVRFAGNITAFLFGRAGHVENVFCIFMGGERTTKDRQ